MGCQILLLVRIGPEEENQAGERSTREPRPGLRLLQAPYCSTFNPGPGLPRRAWCVCVGGGGGGGVCVRAQQPEM